MGNTNFRRHDFGRNRLKAGLNMRIEVNKQEDGKYKASVPGQENLTAVENTEEEAVYTLKKAIQEKLFKGDTDDIKQ